MMIFVAGTTVGGADPGYGSVPSTVTAGRRPWTTMRRADAGHVRTTLWMPDEQFSSSYTVIGSPSRLLPGAPRTTRGQDWTDGLESVTSGDGGPSASVSGKYVR